MAVTVARARLVSRAVWLGADRGEAEAVVGRQVVVGDALVDSPQMTWRTAFGAVLAAAGPPDPVTGWSGGFDVVLANPPWERLKVAAGEHVGDGLARARSQVRERVRAVREGGRHPLTGSGDLNAHLPFVETCWRLLGAAGRAALLVPLGAVTDRQAGALVTALLDAGALESVHGLQQGTWFPDVASRVRVGVITLRRNGFGAPVGAEVVSSVVDPRKPQGDAQRSWTLDRALVRRVNPSSGTAVLFDTRRDADLVARAHERHGVLLERDAGGDVVADPWGFRARTPIHLSREARHLAHAPGPGLEPLREAKLAGLLDPRAATWDAGPPPVVRASRADERSDDAWLPATRWWVPTALVQARYGDLLARGWLAGYRVVSTPRTARTLLPVALPAGAYANSLALLDAPRLPLLLAALSSLPLDYVMRAKAGGNNLSLFKVEQLPVPPPDAYDLPWPGLAAPTLGDWVGGRLAVAVRWCAALEPLAAELAVHRPRAEADPQADGADRAAALADLDAVHAHLMGWSVSDLEHVLGTFTALRAREERHSGRYVTRELVLAAFDRLTPPPPR